MCSSGFKCYRHQNSFQVFFGLGHCNCSQRRGKFLESDNEKLTRLWTKAGSLAMLTMSKRGTWTLEGCLERCAQHSICSLKLVKDQHVVVFVCLVWHIWIYLSTFDLGIDSFECGRWYFHSCTLCSWSLQAWQLGIDQMIWIHQHCDIGDWDLCSDSVVTCGLVVSDCDWASWLSRQQSEENPATALGFCQKRLCMRKPDIRSNYCRATPKTLFRWAIAIGPAT